MEKTKQVYRFEIHTGLYLGTETVHFRNGLWSTPSDCTELEPPFLICVDGYIPIYKDGRWIIVEDNIWRPKPAVEYNYDAGRNAVTYTPISIYGFGRAFPNYPSLPMICNSNLIITEICQKVRVVQRKYKELVEHYDNCRNNVYKLNQYPLDGPPPCLKGYEEHESNQYKYHFLCEELVSHMRTTIDRLVQLSYILTDFAAYTSSKHIKVSQIGSLSTNNNPQADFEKVIVGDGIDFRRDETGFLRCINDLSNSFKHSVMHAEVYNLYGESTATVVSYQAKQNNHKKEITYHNHNACHLVMGFQDTVIRIIQNHRKYVHIKNA